MTARRKDLHVSAAYWDRLCAGDARRGLRRGSALRPLLPRHRLRWHHDGVQGRPCGHRTASDHRALRRQCQWSALAVRGGDAIGHAAAGRGQDGLLQADQHLEPRNHGHRQLQCHAPDLAGGYFNKIQCFCFTEQTLQPGETREEAVVFFVDPEIEKNADHPIPSFHHQHHHLVLHVLSARRSRSPWLRIAGSNVIARGNERGLQWPTPTPRTTTTIW